MSTKSSIIAGFIIALLAFSSGRWLAPTKVVTVTKEVEKKTTDLDKNTHKETTTKTDTHTDGTSTTTTTVVEDTQTDKHTKSTDVSSSSTTVERSRSSLTISALGAFKISDGFTPIYGAQVAKSVLGPINAGAFALTNGTIGLSVGLSF